MVQISSSLMEMLTRWTNSVSIFVRNLFIQLAPNSVFEEMTPWTDIVFLDI